MRLKTSFFDEDDELDMAPMIDMVFLLLIFFMVASHMAKMDRTPVELPVASEAKVPEQRVDRTLITLRSTDLSGETIDVLMNLQVMDLEQLKQRIERVMAEDAQAVICLRADRYVKHRHVKQVMDICAERGAVDIIFAAFEADL